MVQRDVRRSVFVGHHYRQDVVPSLARERGSVVVDREKVLIYPFFYCPFVAPSSFVGVTSDFTIFNKGSQVPVWLLS